MKERMTNIVNEARYYAMGAHDGCGQVRKFNGEPYWRHVERVASSLSRVVPSATDEMIAAAYLHDTVEDTSVTLEMINFHFGLHVARLVQELTKVSRPEDGNRAARCHIDRAFMFKASAESQTIRCFDIADNVLDIAEQNVGFGLKYVPEKLAMYNVLTRADPKARAYCLDALMSAATKIGVKL